jgi:hypothetical protein
MAGIVRDGQVVRESIVKQTAHVRNVQVVREAVILRPVPVNPAISFIDADVDGNFPIPYYYNFGASADYDNNPGLSITKFFPVTFVVT